MKLITIAGLVVSLLSNSAFAMCLGGRHPTVAEELAQSDMVVLGTVVGQTTRSAPDDPEGVDEIIYGFKIREYFKGRPLQGPAEIHSENTSSRFPMDANKKYLVFLKKQKEGFYVDNCGNSTVAGKARATIDMLRKDSNRQH